MKKKIVAVGAMAITSLLPMLFAKGEWIGENPAPKVEAQVNLVGRKVREILPKNCSRFRKAFFLPKGMWKNAHVDVVGLGGYELWLNGTKVDPMRVMAPGWSDPDDRVLFDRYDVLNMLRPGETNVVGVWLSPGYSDDFFDWNWRWLHPKAMALSLQANSSNNQQLQLESDATWEWTDEQPIAAVSIYDGETYDASKADPNWAKATGSVATWHPVNVCAAPKGRLEQNPGPAVHLRDPLMPKSVLPLANGGWILDFGVNRAGLIGFSAKLKKGTKVVIQCSDELRNGRLDMSHLYNANQRDVYIASGVGVETYCPRFTYHGFRYAEITGLDAESIKLVRAWAVQADLRNTASFKCSDDTLNWLWEVSLRTMRGNLLTYVSDCYTRGERTPCLMDSQVFEDTAMIAFDMRDFYGKWLHDAANYELSVDPQVGNNDNPDWAGEPITLAARLVRKYGKVKSVEREYPRLKEIATGFAKRSTNGVWRTGFGDWCAPNEAGSYKGAFSSVAVVNSALLCTDFEEMAYIAEAFGHEDDRRFFEAEAERGRKAFLATFCSVHYGKIGDGRQGDFVLPLALGIIPESGRRIFLNALFHRIHEMDGDKIGTGIYGTRFLGDVLLDAGHGDLWLKMLRGPIWPSFGFMRASGATSLWEQWSCDGGMASHSHAMFAGAAAPLMTRLAGIRTIRDDSREFTIQPCFPKGMTWVEATQTFKFGEVSVCWRREACHIAVLVKLPRETTGRLVLPERSVPLSDGENSIICCASTTKIFGARNARWQGKKMVFLGDSITDTRHIGCTSNYWGFIERDLGILPLVYGINGHQWNGVLEQAKKLVLEHPNDVDAIFIFAGTNDFNADVPPGEWFAIKQQTVNRNGRMTSLLHRELMEDGNTFRGRINAAMKFLRANYVGIPIYLLTPLHRGYAQFGPNNIQQEELYANGLGLFIDDYAKIIREAGVIWSAKVIDVFSESGMLPWMDGYERFFHNAKSDRLHLNNIGHERLAFLIESHLD